MHKLCRERRVGAGLAKKHVGQKKKKKKLVVGRGCHVPEGGHDSGYLQEPGGNLHEQRSPGWAGPPATQQLLGFSGQLGYSTCQPSGARFASFSKEI